MSNREKWKFCRLCSGGVQSFISGVILKFNLWMLFGTAISHLDFFCAFTCVYLSYSITVLYGIRARVYDKFIIAQIPGNITRWIQRATRPSDSWQRCIQLVIFPGICAIIYIYSYYFINFDQLLKPSHQNSQKGCGQENDCTAHTHLINLPQTKSPK